MKNPRLVRELVEIGAITILFLVVIRLLTQSYQVSDNSMQPSFNQNNNVMINKAAYFFRQPERGDVVVFYNPNNTTVAYMRRIIGLPGDTIRVDGMQVSINGVPLKEGYVSSLATPITNTWKVPSDNYFVLGDNRPTSEDSRNWGFVPKNYIVGKAVIVYWPFNAFKIINNPTLSS